MPSDIFETLRLYFEKQFFLPREDFEFIKRQLLQKHLKKGSFLLREGEIATHMAFVSKGCLRSYVIDNKGKEHIVMFAPETWWIGDTDSIRNNAPTIYFIDAIEDSDVLLIDQAAHIKIIQRIPAYANAFQTGVQKHAAAKDKRIVSSLTATAEERYNDFMSTYPSIAQRVPQHMLASYLGITPETLSRIRKQLSRKK